MSNLRVAQPGSAPTLGVGGRWFKASHVDHAAVAPMVERPICNRVVRGSTPRCGTISMTGAQATPNCESTPTFRTSSRGAFPVNTGPVASTSLPGATPGFASAQCRGFFIL